MNELDVLERYSIDVPAASPSATARARARLDHLISGAPPAMTGSGPGAFAGAPERRARRLRFGVRYALALGVVATLVAGVVIAIDREVDRRIAAIPTVHLGAALEPRTAGATGPVNVLVVGSDSRAGTPEAEVVPGQRADTVVLVRITRRGVRSVWVPREVAFPAPGGGTERISDALARGPGALVESVSGALGVPVHHYVELDFGGFASVVDALGGVDVSVNTPVRDEYSGLVLPVGCVHLDGSAALALARSRYMEALVDGSWRFVGQASPTLGRIANEQLLVQAIARRASANLRSPTAALRVLDGITSGLTVDDTFSRGELRTLGAVMLQSFGDASATTLPVTVMTSPGEQPSLVVADGVDVGALLRGGPVTAPSAIPVPADTPVVGLC